MHTQPNRATGHVRLEQRKRDGAAWYARIRRPDGSQLNRKLGRAWTKKGRPADGYCTEQTANKALLLLLAEVEKEAGTTPVRGITFGQAVDEWLRYSEYDRQVRASTFRDYKRTAEELRAHFGACTPLARITPQDVERFKGLLVDGGKQAPRTVNRRLVILGGIFRRAEARWGMSHNPTKSIEKLREPKYGGGLNFLTVEEVWALVRHTPDEQDRAMFLTAAQTGLRQGELLALRWQDVDFAGEAVRVRRSYDQAAKEVGPTKSGKARSVPMTEDVAAELARLEQRERYAEADDLVFPDWDGGCQYHGELRARFYAALRAAHLKRVRFHDLRHTFGTLAAASGEDVTTIQAWMGHAHISTTQIYMHYAPKGDAAKRLTQAFRSGDTARELVRG
jgi:integrase